MDDAVWTEFHRQFVEGGDIPVPGPESSRAGRRLTYSPARRLVEELLYHARQAPLIPTKRAMRLGELVAARRAAEPAVSWYVIFMRAYSILAHHHPVLRRAYIPYPWPHLYEHPQSECSALLEREWEGERVVFGARFRSPEVVELPRLERWLGHFRTAPVESVNYFRQEIRLARLPWLVRRFTFWQTLYLSGRRRAKRFGTFMLSSLGALGAEQCHPICPLTTYLTFGPISPKGRVDVRVIYDHRVMDGCTVARCLRDLEQILTSNLLTEVRALRPARVAVPG